MIHRDDEGNIIGADKLSDLTKAMADIEKQLKKAKKTGISDCSQEEKKELVAKVQDLKVLLSFAGDEMKKSSNPMEVIGFIKQILKFKETAEEFQQLTEEISNDDTDSAQ